jgi:hypothetical protein
MPFDARKFTNEDGIHEFSKRTVLTTRSLHGQKVTKSWCSFTINHLHSHQATLRTCIHVAQRRLVGAQMSGLPVEASK